MTASKKSHVIVLYIPNVHALFYIPVSMTSLVICLIVLGLHMSYSLMSPTSNCRVLLYIYSRFIQNKVVHIKSCIAVVLHVIL